MMDGDENDTWRFNFDSAGRIRAPHHKKASMKNLYLSLCALVFAVQAIAQSNNTSAGEQFFPIAVWSQNPEHALAYKANGINLFINIYGGLNQEKLDQLRQADMKLIPYQNAFALTQLHEPLIHAWMNSEGPDNAQRNDTENKWEPCRDPADVIRGYEEIKKNDPTRPVYLNVGPGAAYTNWIGRGVCRGRTDMYMVANNGYLKACDIASFHIYPMNAEEEELTGKIWYVAKGVDNLQEWSDNAKPAWCWIETTRISERSERKPSPAEVKAMVWMALVHGAKGFGYFCHSFVGKTDDIALLRDHEMIKAVKAINKQVTALAGVLNSEDTKGYASVTSSNPAIPIDVMTKKDGKTNYIFAVAMRDGITSGTFNVKSGKTVEVLGENRTIEIRKGKFTDSFARYGVHLYKVIK